MIRYFFSILTFLLWFSALFYWSAGFQAFTVFSHAETVAGKLPAPFRVPELVGMESEPLPLERFRGRYLLVEFMYLQCPEICGRVRSRLIDIREGLDNQTRRKIRFLSISFDPQRDTPGILRAVHGALLSPNDWVFATFAPDTVEDPYEILRDSGIAIYRRSDGNFNHTARLHLVDPNGVLIERIDPSLTTEAILRVLSGYLR